MLNELLSIQMQTKIDTMFIREGLLKCCENQEQKDKLLDRWAVEDAAENIASAIRNLPRRGGGLFGLF